ncbi:hypothetical protein M3Y96_01056400 [Aphelenchoides besseyi]|nr:hypothetical protein M3Y96_01056400 [Aphelenchoides besseyi]
MRSTPNLKIIRK